MSQKSQRKRKDPPQFHDPKAPVESQSIIVVPDRPGSRYTDAVRLQLLEVLEAYRTRLMDKVGKSTDIPRLLNDYFREILAIISEGQLPPEILKGVRDIVRETFDIITELEKANKRPNSKDATAAAKWHIEAVKEIAHLLLPEAEVPDIRYEQTLTSDVLDFSWVENPVLRRELHENLGTLKFPEGHCGYKGGVARLALKVYAWRRFPERFDLKLLESELPLSDKDAVVAADEDIWEIANEMGVDPEGVEKGTGFDDRGIQLYLGSRDYDMNQALLTERFLFYTPEALESVLSGVIHCAGRAVTLFGVDTITAKVKKVEIVNGERQEVIKELLYFTARIVNRLVIAVVRDRAKSFFIPRYNCEIKLGIYWLVLLRKVYGKPNTAKQIAKIYTVARMMSQTTATSPQQWIKELVEEFPHFDFRANASIEDIARWILTKYTGLIHRWIKHTFGIYGDWGLKSTDETPLVIAPDISTIPDHVQKEAADYLDRLVKTRSSTLPSVA